MLCISTFGKGAFIAYCITAFLFFLELRKCLVRYTIVLYFSQAHWQFIKFKQRIRIWSIRIRMGFDWEDLSKTRDSVWPHFQTPRNSSIIRRCLEMCTLLSRLIYYVQNHSVQYITLPHLTLCRHHSPKGLLCHSCICLIDHTLQRYIEHVVLLHTSRHVGLQTSCTRVLRLPGRTFG